MDEIKQPTAADALAPEPQPQLTLKEYKNLMRQFFTIRRPTVNECGHKFDMERQPNNNCEYCWFAFFQNHGELVQTADEMYQKYGPETLIAMRGKKFVTNFTRFMATIAKFKEEMDAQKAGDTQAPSTPESN